jgi:hypothetical protein
LLEVRSRNGRHLAVSGCDVDGEIGLGNNACRRASTCDWPTRKKTGQMHTAVSVALSNLVLVGMSVFQSFQVELTGPFLTSKSHK